jgi:ATP-dependent DNA helicase RecG
VAAPVQIRVYEDRLSIWNPAVLPEGWRLKDLLGEHASLPYNPHVANAFFRAGEIEAWGRGLQRIFE